MINILICVNDSGIEKSVKEDLFNQKAIFVIGFIYLKGPQR